MIDLKLALLRSFEKHGPTLCALCTVNLDGYHQALRHAKHPVDQNIEAHVLVPIHSFGVHGSSCGKGMAKFQLYAAFNKNFIANESPHAYNAFVPRFYLPVHSLDESGLVSVRGFSAFVSESYRNRYRHTLRH